MASYIDQMRFAYDKMSTEQKGAFIAKLKAKIRKGTPNEYKSFITECVKKYDAEKMKPEYILPCVAKMPGKTMIQLTGILMMVFGFYGIVTILMPGLILLPFVNTSVFGSLSSLGVTGLKVSLITGTARNLSIICALITILDILMPPLVFFFGIAGLSCANRAEAWRTMFTLGSVLLVMHICVVGLEFAVYHPILDVFSQRIGVFPIAWYILPLFYIIGGLRNKKYSAR